MEHSTDLLQGILLLLLMSVTSVTAFRAFKLPPVLGYLLVGAMASEHALNWLPDNHAIEFMGEVGVVFLLFAIGLEFSLKQFMSMRKAVLGLGGLQVLFTVLSSFLILYLLDVSWKGAIVAAGAMAMSSTAIVIKQLTDQNEMRTRHGQLAFSILLFQDIAVVPFLISIPLLAGGLSEDTHTLVMGLEVLVSMSLLAVALWVAHYALRPLFHYIAAAKSVELFNITVLLVALSAGWITQSLGMSLALGAFLAGMLLGETEYKHQIESEIRPFRDLLTGLFFIAVGAKLNVAVLPELWLTILILVGALTLGKALLIAALTRLFVADRGISLRTGIALGQGGEFGFALLALALSNQLLSSDEAQAILAATVISMALAPFLLRYNDTISRKLISDSYLKQRYKAAHQLSLEVKELEDHVIICGYRRIGQSLSRLLEEHNIPYLALELDAEIVKEAWEAGANVHYADATRPEILIAAGIYRARVVVVTVTDNDISKLVTAAARKKQQDIPILVRTRNEQHMEELAALGASEVMPEELEAGLMVAERVMEYMQVSEADISADIDRIRAENYDSLRSYFHGQRQTGHPQPSGRVELHTLVLQEDDPAVGLAIGELNLDKLGLQLKSLRRDDIRGDQPAADTLLRSQDILVIEGKREAFQQAEKRWAGERKSPTNPSIKDLPTP